MLRLFLLAALVAAEAPDSEAQLASEASSCGGSIAASVVGTLVVVALLLAGGYLLWKAYWKGKSGQHLVLLTDPEKGDSVYAFDNPGFKEGPPAVQSEEKESQKLKWAHWTSIGIVSATNPKVKAMDDSYTAQPALNIVPLRSHDFTGLGFNICGNMRDGIFVKDVLHRGPASESGRIMPGDRIDSVKISLRHMVLEDALTILSYASPYEVELAVETRSGNPGSTLLRTPPPPHRICHPFYRSHSISDLQQIGKSNSRRMGEQPSSLMSDISANDPSKPATLDRKPKFIEAERNQNTRNCIIENVQKQENIFHTIDLDKDEVDKGKESSPTNVKSLLVKGIQNLKEKLQNSLHQDEGKEEPKSNNTSRHSTLDKGQKDDGFKSVELTVPTDVPEEVQRAGLAARTNRKSIIEECVEVISNESEDPVAAKRNKRKAPMPPQEKEDEINGSTESINHIPSLESVDSDSEIGDKSGTTIELNSSHITVHHAPDTESRKASSLGDLSRYETENVVVLERAVSLDLADGAPGCKKRKAPLPPQEDCLTPYKEARLDTGGTGTLKKSSVWGTLEDVIQTGSDSETDLGISGCSTPERNDVVSSSNTFLFSSPAEEMVSSTPYKSDENVRVVASTDTGVSSVQVSSCSWDLSFPENSEYMTAVNGGDDTPPELPTSPMPTIHSYITEIQVSATPKNTDMGFVHLDGTEQLMDHMNIYKFDTFAGNGDSPEETVRSETLISVKTPDKSPRLKHEENHSGDSDSSPISFQEELTTPKMSPPQKKNPDIVKPARSNVTVTNFKATPSRIPVRAGQRSPGISLSPASDKRNFSHRNGHGSP